MTPGPVEVPDFVTDAISQPVIPHRSIVFESFYSKLLDDLKYFFQTSNHTCCMIGSGTYGVENAMYSLFHSGNEVIVVAMGKFSQRWIDYSKQLGLNVIEINKPWGETVSPEEISSIVKEHPYSKGIVLTHCETSTGVLLDLEEIIWEIKSIRKDMLICVDAITSVGAVPFYFDSWDVDCAIVASQKSLMNPAGVCAFALSERAVRSFKQTHHSDFRNLYNYLSLAQRGSYPYTPPVQLLYGIQASLTYFRQMELPQIWNQVHIKAKTFRKGLQEIGGELFGTDHSASLTAFYFPQQEMNLIKTRLEKKYNIFVSGGQGHLKGKILRISHMGMSTKEDMQEVVDLLKPNLQD